MSFTQEQKLNINVCTGCDLRCKFGFTTESFTSEIHECEEFYPTLAGKPIKSYLDRFGRQVHTVIKVIDGRICPTGQFITAPWRQEIENTQLEQAYEIAKLCDHYKTR